MILSVNAWLTFIIIFLLVLRQFLWEKSHTVLTATLKMGKVSKEGSSHSHNWERDYIKSALIYGCIESSRSIQGLYIKYINAISNVIPFSTNKINKHETNKLYGIYNSCLQTTIWPLNVRNNQIQPVITSLNAWPLTHSKKDRLVLKPTNAQTLS